MRFTRALALFLALLACTPMHPALAQLGTQGSPMYVNCPTCSGGSGGGGVADVYNSGSIAAATTNAAYVVNPSTGQSTGTIVLSGLTASGATLVPEGSYDGANFVAVPVYQAGSKVALATLTADGQYRFPLNGRRAFRFRVSAVGSGSINAISTLSVAPFDAPAAALDSNGDLRTPTVTMTAWYVSLAANTSTTILAASSSRIGFDIQCSGAAPVGISRVGATLTKVTPDTTSSGGVDVVVPASSTPPLYIPVYASRTQPVTAYTATPQACWGTNDAQQ